MQIYKIFSVVECNIVYFEFTRKIKIRGRFPTTSYLETHCEQKNEIPIFLLTAAEAESRPRGGGIDIKPKV